nr:hypothetical protein CFP56_68594 [Quercus suber]
MRSANLSLINFLNQVQSSQKSWQGFGNMNEVTWGGNALKFDAVAPKFCTKLDIRKAYDSVLWDAFFNTLEHLKFPKSWVTSLGICMQMG